LGSYAAAIKKMAAIDPHVTGTVSSGYSEEPELTGFKEYGFCGAVAKPYTLEELGSKLGRMIFFFVSKLIGEIFTGHHFTAIKWIDFHLPSPIMPFRFIFLSIMPCRIK